MATRPIQFTGMEERHKPKSELLPRRQHASHMSSIDAYYYADKVRNRRIDVRTTVNLDDQLLEEAQRLTGISQRAALLRESLRALIERESARRLARLGGSARQLRPVRRRKVETSWS